MAEKTMLHLMVDGEPYTCEKGTTYGQIASHFAYRYPYDILLAQENNRLRELHRAPENDCSVSLLTGQNKHAERAYERSAQLLMLRAFYAVLGHEKLKEITVEFTMSAALFVHARGDFELTQPLLDRVEEKMRRMVADNLPIEKSTMDTDEAVELFLKQGMLQKAKLFRYRLSSETRVYTLDGFTDYFYGYMLPSAGLIKQFKLELFEDGFVLRLPNQNNPAEVAPFKPSYKVFKEMNETTSLSHKIGISSVGELNQMVSKGQATQMILSSEALMEKKIGDVAQQIAQRKGVRFVMIAGPSSSGKTTFSHRLSVQLRACGLKPYPIATDNYFVNRDQTPRNEKGEYDFECLEAMDVAQFNEDMNALLRGETIKMPTYNFKKGVREYNGETLTLHDDDVLVIEGIHCLNDKFTAALPAESKFRIYISALTTLNIDHHNRIPTTDARLLRRIERDARTRGHSAQATIKMWPNVRKGEEDNIFPYQDSADVIFNSNVVYETALLRSYVEPLLFDIPHDCPEYLEAKRLLKFLSYFMPIPSDSVPATSITREFIGGGCYQV